MNVIGTEPVDKSLEDLLYQHRGGMNPADPDGAQSKNPDGFFSSQSSLSDD